MMRITPLYDLKLRSPKCASLPLPLLPLYPPNVPNFPLECTCALLPPPTGNITRAKMDALAEAYDRAMLDVIEEWENEGDPYLGVIWQPGEAIDLARWEEEALSGVDCFHPSLEAHKRVGSGFWNRMTLDLVSGFCSRQNVEQLRVGERLNESKSNSVLRAKEAQQQSGQHPMASAEVWEHAGTEKARGWGRGRLT